MLFFVVSFYRIVIGFVLFFGKVLTVRAVICDGVEKSAVVCYGENSMSVAEKAYCPAVNNVIMVVNGTPANNITKKEPKSINVDCTTIVDGYYGDASRTFIIGKAPKKAVDLVEVTRQCLKLGLEAAKPWAHLGDIGAAISSYARKRGYSVVTEFGGHGCGVEFHEDPFVCHVGKKNTGMVLVPGMTFTIEPMINMGKPGVFVDESNDWTVYTKDGSLSAQFEHTILITETGIEILSK